MVIKRGIIILFSGLLVACGDDGYQDLVAFMAQVKAKPAGHIEPIPTFKPYEPFDYSATMLRAPFDRPVEVEPSKIEKQETVPAPDPRRPKEYLEQFSIESLVMVGTIEQYGQLWVLIRDREGNVHYVKNGNYIGKNNGEIVETTPTYIQVVEVVSSGQNWVERPRTIELREK